MRFLRHLGLLISDLTVLDHEVKVSCDEEERLQMPNTRESNDSSEVTLNDSANHVTVSSQTQLYTGIYIPLLPPTSPIIPSTQPYDFASANKPTTMKLTTILIGLVGTTAALPLNDILTAKEAGMLRISRNGIRLRLTEFFRYRSAIPGRSQAMQQARLQVLVQHASPYL